MSIISAPSRFWRPGEQDRAGPGGKAEEVPGFPEAPLEGQGAATFSKSQGWKILQNSFHILISYCLAVHFGIERLHLFDHVPIFE